MVRTILLADDNDELRISTNKALSRVGYQVIEAADGAALHDQVARGLKDGALPDLILSDIRMPWSSGLLLLERLRGLDCRVPVILMSAFCDEATQATVARLGAFLLSKPFRMEELLREVSVRLD